MRATLDEMACPTMQSKDLRRWLLLEDSVLWHQASSVMGPTNLQALAKEYEEQGLLFEAAKVNLPQVSIWMGIHKRLVAIVCRSYLHEQTGNQVALAILKILRL